VKLTDVGLATSNGVVDTTSVTGTRSGELPTPDAVTSIAPWYVPGTKPVASIATLTVAGVTPVAFTISHEVPAEATAENELPETVLEMMSCVLTLTKALKVNVEGVAFRIDLLLLTTRSTGIGSGLLPASGEVTNTAA
jgi:hypothetical protein